MHYISFPAQPGEIILLGICLNSEKSVSELHHISKILYTQTNTCTNSNEIPFYGKVTLLTKIKRPSNTTGPNPHDWSYPPINLKK